MKKQNLWTGFVAILLGTSSCVTVDDSCCGPDKTSELSGLPVAIYSVENTYKGFPNRCEVDLRTVQIKEELLKNEEILSYSEKELAFTVTPTGYERISNLTHMQPFVLSVAGDIALVGYFKLLKSQSVCEHSVLMNVGENNKVYFFLGNPTALSEAEKIAKVNSRELLDALKKTDKWRR
jgi:hypothetical protein